MTVDKIAIAIIALGSLASAPLALADDDRGDSQLQVSPRVYDPFHSNLAFSGWLPGIGCPSSATVNTTGNKNGGTPYRDPACATGDPQDKNNQGLLLAKTGPTANYAAAVADIKHLPSNTVTELGYDIRRPAYPGSDPRGSHCGAGAPRFDITTVDGKNYFVGCNSPAATQVVTGNGWVRLRWGGSAGLSGYNAATGTLEPITSGVKSISIVFDEGQDTGADFSGAAVLDNIDVNGVLAGRGNSSGGSEDERGDH